jgi:chemotaxis protein CheX
MNTTTTAPKAVLDATLINALVHATTEVLGTMASTSVKLQSVTPQMDYKPTGDISAVIGINGEQGEGTLALSFHNELATVLVSRLLGLGDETLSREDMLDGIAELINMVSGRAKTDLSATSANPYKLSLPSLIVGANHEIAGRPKNCPVLVLLFEAEGHTFHLQVSFRTF